MTKSNTSPEELGPLANQLTSDYGRLASQAKPAAVAAENEEVNMEAVLPFLRRDRLMPLVPMAASRAVLSSLSLDNGHHLHGHSIKSEQDCV